MIFITIKNQMNHHDIWRLVSFTRLVIRYSTVLSNQLYNRATALMFSSEIDIKMMSSQQSKQEPLSFKCIIDYMKSQVTSFIMSAF